eukprot:7628542-Pyramimonas_sp.AAC.1
MRYGAEPSHWRRYDEPFADIMRYAVEQFHGKHCDGPFADVMRYGAGQHHGRHHDATTLLVQPAGRWSKPSSFASTTTAQRSFLYLSSAQSLGALDGPLYN